MKKRMVLAAVAMLGCGNDATPTDGGTHLGPDGANVACMGASIGGGSAYTCVIGGADGVCIENNLSTGQNCYVRCTVSGGCPVGKIAMSVSTTPTPSCYCK